eukprot:2537113-Amphidinium_carterae.1
MTIQELRAKVRHEEEREELHQGGAYVAPTIPNLQQYKDRLDILETRGRRRSNYEIKKSLTDKQRIQKFQQNKYKLQNLKYLKYL